MAVELAHEKYFLYPARGHFDTRCTDIAKCRKVFLVRHFCSTDKQISGLGTDIAVTCCVICDRLLFKIFPFVGGIR
jgi:hypothetical protein